MRLGIPRALLFWSYAPLWVSFFRELGVEVVVSGETTRTVLDAGVRLTVDEACLPVKVFFGHCASLVTAADLLFVPRLVSVEPGAYICPKFMGLPDMIRHAFRERIRLLSPVVDFHRTPGRLDLLASEVADALGAPRGAAGRALRSGLAALESVERHCERGSLPPDSLAYHGLVETGEGGAGRRGPCQPSPPRRLGVLGHPYNLYDRQLSMDLLRRLKEAGWKVLTPETVPAKAREEGASELPKKLFWTLGRRVYGAAAHFTDLPVSGLIHLVSFGCGPDSLVGELVHGLCARKGVPFLLLTLDEHTGEAGLWTRVEAFLDMVERREVTASRRS